MGSKASPLSPQHFLRYFLKKLKLQERISEMTHCNEIANLQVSLILHASKCNLGSKKKKKTTKKIHQNAVTTEWLLLQ